MVRIKIKAYCYLTYEVDGWDNFSNFFLYSTTFTVPSTPKYTIWSVRI